MITSTTLTSAMNDDPLGAELADFRASVRRWLEHEVVPRDEAAPATRAPQAAYADAATLGFIGIHVPEDQGGMGIDDPRFSAVFAEETIAVGLSGFGLPLALHDRVAVHATAAVPELTAQLLGEIASGTPAAIALHDEVQLNSDGTLSGTVGPVPGAAHAVTGLLTVRDQRENELVVAVSLEADGVHRGSEEQSLGLAGGGSAEITFERTPINEHGTMGGSGAVASLRARERLTLAVIAIALAKRALSLTVGYVQERRVFGGSLAAVDNTRLMLAESAAEVAVAGEFVSGCMRALGDDHLRPELAAIAWLRAAEALRRAADTGVQLHGGYGYMLDYPIAHCYADASCIRRWGGTTTADVIGDALLGPAA